VIRDPAIIAPAPYREVDDDPVAAADSRIVTSGTVTTDYAYALTAHAAQGGEWPRVRVIDVPVGRAASRCRYTAASRTRSKLIALSNTVA
jgi:hypothetical protein